MENWDMPRFSSAVKHETRTLPPRGSRPLPLAGKYHPLTLFSVKRFSNMNMMKL